MKYYNFEPSETKLFYQKILEADFSLNEFEYPLKKEGRCVGENSSQIRRTIFFTSHDNYSFQFLYSKQTRNYQIMFFPDKIIGTRELIQASSVSEIIPPFEKWLYYIKRELKAEEEIKHFFERAVNTLPGITFNLNVNSETQKDVLSKLNSIEKLIFEVAEMQADELNEMSEKNEKINLKLQQIEQKLDSINWQEVIVSSAIGNIAGIVQNDLLKEIIKNYIQTHFGIKLLQ